MRVTIQWFGYFLVVPIFIISLFSHMKDKLVSCGPHVPHLASGDDLVASRRVFLHLCIQSLSVRVYLYRQTHTAASLEIHNMTLYTSNIISLENRY